MYGLMFLLAWPFLIMDALGSQGLISKPPMILGFATGWAPGIAAIVVTAMIAGRQGVSDLLRRFLIWRVGLQWYLVALFVIAAMILGGIWLHSLFGGTMPTLPLAGASILNVALSFIEKEGIDKHCRNRKRCEPEYAYILMENGILVPEVRQVENRFGKSH